MPAKQQTSTSLDAVHFTSFLNGRQEPSWLTTQRREAWAAFEAADMPFWRRTSLKGFQFSDFSPASAQVTISWDGSDAGVVVLPLAEAIDQHPELVQKVLYSAIRSDRDKFAALNNAFVADGVFVYVPKNTTVEQPIHVQYAVPAAGAMVAVRTLALIEHHSSATIIEEYVSSDPNAPAMVLSGAEITLADEANVTFNSVQTLGAQVYNFGGQQLRLLGKDAHAEWVNLVIGAKTQNVRLEADLQGNGSNIEWNGLIYANRQQQLLVAPTLHHAGLNTEGQINFKTVVDDEAYAVFDGMVRIPKTGQGTNSDLRENALHLSKNSRSDSIPGLEIDANEVKAGHGSTSGQLDEEQLFYLLSRGLPPVEAKRMIVLGFVGEIIDLLADEDLRDQIEALVAAKI